MCVAATMHCMGMYMMYMHMHMRMGMVPALLRFAAFRSRTMAGALNRRRSTRHTPHTPARGAPCAIDRTHELALPHTRTGVGRGQATVRGAELGLRRAKWFSGRSDLRSDPAGWVYVHAGWMRMYFLYSSK